MTLKDAIRSARTNKGHIYTTDELWADDENCILIDNLGNLIFGDGEPVTNEGELPQDGWYDATDIEEQDECSNWDNYRANTVVDSVLWDEEDNCYF